MNPPPIDLEAALHEVRASAAVPPNLMNWAKGGGDPASLAAAYSILSTQSALTFEPEAALWQSDEAIRLYSATVLDALSNDDRVVHNHLLWTAHNTRAKALDYIGGAEESVSAHRTALLFAEATDYSHGILISQFNLCTLLLRNGDATEATFEALQSPVLKSPSLAEAFRPLRHEAMAYIYYGSGLPDKALEELRVAVDPNELKNEFNSLQLMIDLAYLEAGHGQPANARRALELLHNHVTPNQPVRLVFAMTTAEARLLTREGRFDEALELLNTIDVSGPAKVFNDMANPIIGKTETLVRAQRYREALDYINDQSQPLGYLAETRLKKLRARALAGLERWDDALLAGRLAEKSRQRFDLDPEQYLQLCYPDGIQPAEASTPPVIADLYARQIRLRDLLGHDIRGLFNSVQLAYRAAVIGSDPDRHRAKLDQLVSLIDALHDVPANAAAYLQLVDDSAAVEVDPVRVADVVDDVLDHYRLSAHGKGLALRRERSPDVRVLADTDMLQACLSNLISNGLKFSNNHGTVSVGWAATDASNGDGSLIEISVSDQGPGLTTEEQSQIFRRARTSSAPPTGGETSSGLGHHIVMGFLDQMMGHVRVEHNPGGGSRFIMTLQAADAPLTDPSMIAECEYVATATDGAWALDGAPPIEPGKAVEPARSANLTNRSASTRPRAFVIDDDRAAVTALADLIGSSGAEVVTATSFDEARVITRTSPAFHLVVCDVMLDGVPLGLEIVRRIRRYMPHALIVLATGLSELFEAIPAEADQVLRKPIRYQQVVELLDQADAAARSAGRATTTVGADLSPVLSDVVNGRNLQEQELIDLISAPDLLTRIKGLIIASIHEAIQGHLQYSLQLALQAKDAIDNDGPSPGMEFLWQLHNNLGIVYRDLGRLVTATKQLEETLTLAKESNFEYGLPRTAMNLAIAYDQLGMADRAIEVLAEATHQIGADQRARAQLFSALGRQLFQQGETNLAIAQYRRSLSNFSPIEVEDIRITLRWLAEAYLEAADFDSARVVLKRLERTDEDATQSTGFVGFNQSVRAALALAEGNHREAKGLASAGLSLMLAGQKMQFSRIPVNVILKIFADLGRHRDAVDFWRHYAEIPPLSTSPRTLLAVAKSLEALGETKEACDLENRAYRIRSRRSLELPTLVALARDFAVSEAAERGAAKRLSDEDHTELWARTNKLLDLIRELRSATTSLAAKPWRAERPHEIEVALGPKITELEYAVVAFDKDSLVDPLPAAAV